MIRSVFFGALASLAFAAPATADIYGNLGTVVQAQSQGTGMVPPAGYRGQWFTSADGCDYSRAGRPGEEVWYLIINTAHSGCRIRIIVSAFSDYN